MDFIQRVVYNNLVGNTIVPLSLKPTGVRIVLLFALATYFAYGYEYKSIPDEGHTRLTRLITKSDRRFQHPTDILIINWINALIQITWTILYYIACVFILGNIRDAMHRTARNTGPLRPPTFYGTYILGFMAIVYKYTFGLCVRNLFYRNDIYRNTVSNVVLLDDRIMCYGRQVVAGFCSKCYAYGHTDSNHPNAHLDDFSLTIATVNNIWSLDIIEAKYNPVLKNSSDIGLQATYQMIPNFEQTPSSFFASQSHRLGQIVIDERSKFREHFFIGVMPSAVALVPASIPICNDRIVTTILGDAIINSDTNIPHYALIPYLDEEHLNQKLLTLTTKNVKNITIYGSTKDSTNWEPRYSGYSTVAFVHAMADFAHTINQEFDNFSRLQINKLFKPRSPVHQRNTPDHYSSDFNQEHLSDESITPEPTTKQVNFDGELYEVPYHYNGDVGKCKRRRRVDQSDTSSQSSGISVDDLNLRPQKPKSSPRITRSSTKNWRTPLLTMTLLCICSGINAVHELPYDTEQPTYYVKDQFADAICPFNAFETEPSWQVKQSLHALQTVHDSPIYIATDQAFEDIDFSKAENQGHYLNEFVNEYPAGLNLQTSKNYRFNPSNHGLYMNFVNFVLNNNCIGKVEHLRDLLEAFIPPRRPDILTDTRFPIPRLYTTEEMAGTPCFAEFRRFIEYTFNETFVIHEQDDPIQPHMMEGNLHIMPLTKSDDLYINLRTDYGLVKDGRELPFLIIVIIPEQEEIADFTKEFLQRDDYESAKAHMHQLCVREYANGPTIHMEYFTTALALEICQNCTLDFGMWNPPLTLHSKFGSHTIRETYRYSNKTTPIYARPEAITSIKCRDPVIIDEYEPEKPKYDKEFYYTQPAFIRYRASIIALRDNLDNSYVEFIIPKFVHTSTQYDCKQIDEKHCLYEPQNDPSIQSCTNVHGLKIECAHLDNKCIRLAQIFCSNADNVFSAISDSADNVILKTENVIKQAKPYLKPVVDRVPNPFASEIFKYYVTRPTRKIARAAQNMGEQIRNTTQDFVSKVNETINNVNDYIQLDKTELCEQLRHPDYYDTLYHDCMENVIIKLSIFRINHFPAVHVEESDIILSQATVNLLHESIGYIYNGEVHMYKRAMRYQPNTYTIRYSITPTKVGEKYFDKYELKWCKRADYLPFDLTNSPLGDRIDDTCYTHWTGDQRIDWYLDGANLGAIFMTVFICFISFCYCSTTAETPKFCYGFALLTYTYMFLRIKQPSINRVFHTALLRFVGFSSSLNFFYEYVNILLFQVLLIAISLQALNYAYTTTPWHKTGIHYKLVLPVSIISMTITALFYGDISLNLLGYIFTAATILYFIVRRRSITIFDRAMKGETLTREEANAWRVEFQGERTDAMLQTAYYSLRSKPATPENVRTVQELDLWKQINDKVINENVVSFVPKIQSVNDLFRSVIGAEGKTANGTPFKNIHFNLEPLVTLKYCNTKLNGFICNGELIIERHLFGTTSKAVNNPIWSQFVSEPKLQLDLTCAAQSNDFWIIPYNLNTTPIAKHPNPLEYSGPAAMYCGDDRYIYGVANKTRHDLSTTEGDCGKPIFCNNGMLLGYHIGFRAQSFEHGIWNKIFGTDEFVFNYFIPHNGILHPDITDFDLPSERKTPIRDEIMPVLDINNVLAGIEYLTNYFGGKHMGWHKRLRTDFGITEEDFHSAGFKIDYGLVLKNLDNIIHEKFGSQTLFQLLSQGPIRIKPESGPYATSYRVGRMMTSKFCNSPYVNNEHFGELCKLAKEYTKNMFVFTVNYDLEKYVKPFRNIYIPMNPFLYIHLGYILLNLKRNIKKKPTHTILMTIIGLFLVCATLAHQHMYCSGLAPRLRSQQIVDTINSGRQYECINHMGYDFKFTRPTVPGSPYLVRNKDFDCTGTHCVIGNGKNHCEPDSGIIGKLTCNLYRLINWKQEGYTVLCYAQITPAGCKSIANHYEESLMDKIPNIMFIQWLAIKGFIFLLYLNLSEHVDFYCYMFYLELFVGYFFFQFLHYSMHGLASFLFFLEAPIDVTFLFPKYDFVWMKPYLFYTLLYLNHKFWHFYIKGAVWLGERLRVYTYGNNPVSIKSEACDYTKNSLSKVLNALQTLQKYETWRPLAPITKQLQDIYDSDDYGLLNTEIIKNSIENISKHPQFQKLHILDGLDSNSQIAALKHSIDSKDATITDNYLKNILIGINEINEMTTRIEVESSVAVMELGQIPFETITEEIKTKILDLVERIIAEINDYQLVELTEVFEICSRISESLKLEIENKPNEKRNINYVFALFDRLKSKTRRALNVVTAQLDAEERRNQKAAAKSIQQQTREAAERKAAEIKKTNLAYALQALLHAYCINDFAGVDADLKADITRRLSSMDLNFQGITAVKPYATLSEEDGSGNIDIPRDNNGITAENDTNNNTTEKTKPKVTSFLLTSIDNCIYPCGKEFICDQKHRHGFYACYNQLSEKYADHLNSNCPKCIQAFIKRKHPRCQAKYSNIEWRDLPHGFDFRSYLTRLYSCQSCIVCPTCPPQTREIDCTNRHYHAKYDPHFVPEAWIYSRPETDMSKLTLQQEDNQICLKNSAGNTLVYSVPSVDVQAKTTTKYFRQLHSPQVMSLDRDRVYFVHRSVNDPAYLNALLIALHKQTIDKQATDSTFSKNWDQ